MTIDCLLEPEETVTEAQIISVGLAEEQAAELQILTDKVLASSSLNNARKFLEAVKAEIAKIPGQRTVVIGGFKN